MEYITTKFVPICGVSNKGYDYSIMRAEDDEIYELIRRKKHVHGSTLYDIRYFSRLKLIETLKSEEVIILNDSAARNNKFYELI